MTKSINENNPWISFTPFYILVLKFNNIRQADNEVFIYIFGLNMSIKPALFFSFLVVAQRNMPQTQLSNESTWLQYIFF